MDNNPLYVIGGAGTGRNVECTVSEILSVHLKRRSELKSFVENLEAAQSILGAAVAALPALHTALRALHRVRKAVCRPFRIAFLGESNSGKSSLANLFIGEKALPALPVANTRLPTLLQYSQVAFVRACNWSGERYLLSGASCIALEPIMRVEVGLPIEALERVEILDFPGNANPLLPVALAEVLRHGVDAAVWTTVATQAWRESERAAWLGLPLRLRLQGILAVTHCDLVATPRDLSHLQARLERDAKQHFQAMCFLNACGGSGSGMQPGVLVGSLFSEIELLAEKFIAGRLRKSVTVTQRLATQTFDRLLKESGSKEIT
jgi:Dynamin family